MISSFTARFVILFAKKTLFTHRLLRTQPIFVSFHWLIFQASTLSLGMFDILPSPSPPTQPFSQPFDPGLYRILIRSPWPHYMFQDHDFRTNTIS